MKEIELNGYIDEESWYGDEITPKALHELVYGEGGEAGEEIHIKLNSYGGNVNAAVRMYDDLRAYKGKVGITISGTCASAATLLCMAAGRLEMTPGSVLMIHDPSMMAFGNEKDLKEAIKVLRVCKDSILNIYEQRVKPSREQVADMMEKTTWMDAKEALAYGFVDGITEPASPYAVDAAKERCVDVKEAEKKVNDWLERKRKFTEEKPEKARADAPEARDEKPEAAEEAPAGKENPKASETKDEENPKSTDRISVGSMDRRLENLKY